MYGGVPSRDFYVPVDLGDSLKQVAELDAYGSFANTTPVIYDNYIFMADLSGRVHAFNVDSGKTIGYEKFGGTIEIAPVLYNFRMFNVINESEKRFSTISYFDFFVHKILAEIPIPGKVTNEMLKLDDGIIVLTDEGTLYKINYAGIKDWSVKTNVNVYGSPAYSDGLIVFGNIKGELVAVNEKTQKIEYRKKICQSIEGGATISEGNIFIGDAQGVLYSIDLKSGTINWRFDTGTKIKSIPVFNDDQVFIGNLNGDLFSVDKKSGQKIWETATEGIINTTPLLFNDYLVQPNVARKVFLIDIKNGDIVKTIEYDRRVKTTPVYYQHKLFIGVDKSSMFVYQAVNSN